MNTYKRFLTSTLLGLLLIGSISSVTAQQLSDRQKTAQAMFAERCKRAGEKIYKTVESVEGIFLMKVRPKEINFGDQFALTDPYGEDLGGKGYIGSLLRDEYQSTHSGKAAPGWPPRVGYRYAEAIDPKDGQRYQYTGSVKEVTRTTSIMMGGDGKTVFKTKEFVLDRIPAAGPVPRYGVTYDDISTYEEREYWIAGSSLKVIDLKTNEVIAERIGYMMDRAQGSKAGNRSPWLFAADNACPDFYRNYKNLVRSGRSNGSGAQSYQTLDFVEKVLKPSR